MRIGNTLYLDYQASTPVDARVLEAMTPYLEASFANPHSADHAAGWQAAEAVERAASQLAQLIGADPDEIIFTSGATEANNLALLGFGRRAVASRRRRILLSTIEHKCVLAVGRALEEQLGYRVESVPVDREGRIKLPELERLIDDDVLIVSIMAANNEIGTIQDIESISQLTRKHGVIFHSDGAQAPCAVSLANISRSVDLLSLSGHKMYGPKGIGALYIRRDLQNHVEPLIYGGGQQNNLRSGTMATPLCVGMGAAAETFSCEGSDVERTALLKQRDQFVRRLETLGWPVVLNGPPDVERHPGNANICFKGFSAHDILGALQPLLAASTGSACTTGTPEPSHVLQAIGLEAPDADASIRFSFGRGTSETDLDHAIGLIDNTLSRLTDAGAVRSA